MTPIASYFEEQEAKILALEARLATLEDVDERLAALEARLVKMEQTEAANAEAEAEQEAKIDALEARIIEMEQQVAAFTATADVSKVSGIPADIENLDSSGVSRACEENDFVNESEDIATDEETGLPELEVELEEDIINESEEIATDEETGLPELEVEIEEEDLPAEGEDAGEEVDEASVAEEAELEVPITEAPVTEVPVTEVPKSVVPKLDDLKKGITMGDRFLFQRELFSNNGELMNRTIENLNHMSSLAEAESYIAQQFAWNKESNAYELFANLLKRHW